MTNKLAYGIMECMLSRNENELISIGENLGSVCQAGQAVDTVIWKSWCWKNNIGKRYCEGSWH